MSGSENGSKCHCTTGIALEADQNPLWTAPGGWFPLGLSGDHARTMAS